MTSLRIRRSFLSSTHFVVGPNRVVIATAKWKNGRVLIWYDSETTALPDYIASIDSQGDVQILGQYGKVAWIRIENIRYWLSNSTIFRGWTERGGVVAEGNIDRQGGLFHLILGIAIPIGIGIHLAWSAVTEKRNLFQEVINLSSSTYPLLACAAIAAIFIVVKMLRPLFERFFAKKAYSFSPDIGELTLGLWPRLVVAANDYEELRLLIVLSLVRLYGIPLRGWMDLNIVGGRKI